MHVFGTFIPFKENSSGHFKDCHKMELLTNFDIILTLLLGDIK